MCRKPKREKKQRLDKRCKDVYEKIVMSLPLQEDTSFSMEHDISKHSLNIKAMVCDVTSHDSKALVELKERGVFSRKPKREKKQRLDKRCKNVYEKIVMSLPLQEDTSFSMEHDISKHGLNIKAMVCDVTSHDSKALVELKERGVFSRPAWNLLSNLVPPIVHNKICSFLFPNEDGLVINEDDTNDDSDESENEDSKESETDSES